MGDGNKKEVMEEEYGEARRNKIKHTASPIAWT
jgi:hypothetical protein